MTPKNYSIPKNFLQSAKHPRIAAVAYLDGRFKTVSKELAQLLGFPIRELRGKPFLDFIHPEDRERAYSDVKRLVHSGTLQGLEHRWLTAPGGYVNIRWDGFADQASGLMYGVGTNISTTTENRQDAFAEALIAAFSEEAIFVNKIDGTIERWYKGAERVYGYTAEEILGQPVSLLFPPNRRGAVQQLTAKILQGERISLHETDQLGKNRKHFPARMTLVPLRELRGAITGALVRVTPQSPFSSAKRTFASGFEGALFDFIKEDSSFTPLDAFYGMLLEKICAATGCRWGTIVRKDENTGTVALVSVIGISRSGHRTNGEQTPARSLGLEAMRTGQPMIASRKHLIREYPQEPLRTAKALSYLAFPLRSGQNIIGAVTLAHPDLLMIGDEKIGRMQMLSECMSQAITKKQLALDVKRLDEQVSELTTRVYSMVEEEREWIAREIHDELGQDLAMLHLELTFMASEVLPSQKHVWKKLKHLIQLANACLGHIQEISRSLRPFLPENIVLSNAIAWQAKEFQKRTHIKCHFAKSPGDIQIDQPRSIALFRIVREALTNVVRHARATKVQITLTKSPDQILLKIRDNGVGILPGQIVSPGSVGLLTMKEAVRPWNGSVSITGTPKDGTQVIASVRLL